MTNNNFVSGFDMSFLTSEKVDIAIGRKTRKNAKDDVDFQIDKMELQNNYKVVDQLMEELHLHKFWKKLKSSKDYHVFLFLARDRMLNFYEGATGAGFNVNTIRIGMVVAACTATLKTNAEVRQMPTVQGPFPCFMTSKQACLEDLEINCLTPVEIQEANTLIDKFYRTSPSAKKLTNGNRLQVYLCDAFRLWTVSTDNNLKQFMSGMVNRKEFLGSEIVHRMNIRGELGWGSISHYPALLELTCFNTVWGRAKSFKYNIPNILKAINK